MVLLLDMLWSYGPLLTDLYGPGSLGSSELFSWYSELPRWRWSLFRGFDHPFLSSFALISWFATTFMLFFCRNSFRTIWIVWLISGVLFQFGLWSRAIASETTTVLAWLVSLVPWIIATVFLIMALKKKGAGLGWITFGWALTTILLAIGIWLVPLAKDGNAPYFRTFLQTPWDASP